MGQHNALDGLITFLELQACGDLLPNLRRNLAQAIADMDEMCDCGYWATDDPLGIGGMLDASARLAILTSDGELERRTLLRGLLVQAEQSLAVYHRSADLGRPAHVRLAFRELGLAIGIHGLEKLSEQFASDHELSTICRDLLRYQPLAEQIEQFWSDPMNRTSISWRDHQDINGVMLATSLAPEGYFGR